ncbi:MAG: lipopolysaccharide biosynthesis protein [Saccharofermentanales bacterium]
MPDYLFSYKKVLKNSSIYTIVGILQKAIGFLLLPIYTAFLSPADYGISALINTFTAFVTLLITLALTGAVTRFYFEYKDYEKKLKDFFSTIVFIILVISTITFILLCIFNKIIEKYIMQSVPFYPLMLLGIIATVSSPIYSIYQSILQVQQKAKIYVINSTCYFLFLVSGNIVFIVIFRLGIMGLLLASAIVNIIFCIYSIFILLKQKTIKFIINFKMLRESLQYSLPLLPHILSNTISNFISKNYLNIIANISSVGLFNIATQITNLLDIVQTSINAAFIPWFYNSMGKGKAEHESIANLVNVIFTFICLITFGIALFSKEIILFMTSSIKYHIAWRIIPLICFASLFQFIYIIYSNTLFYNKKATKFLWIISFSGNIIHIIFSIMFTKKFDYLTPAYAMILQKIIMAAFAYFLSKKKEPIDLKISKILLKTIVIITISVILLYNDWININNLFNGRMLILKIILYLVIIFAFLFEYQEKIITNIHKLLKSEVINN